jgi:hypothetical protein
MGPGILSFEDREYVLRRLQERENAIMEEVNRLRDTVTRLEDEQGELSEGLRGGFEELRAGFDRLTSAVLQHVQAESEADRTRDALVREHSVSLAVIAGAAGAKTGRGSGAISGGIVSAIVTGTLVALAKLLGSG